MPLLLSLLACRGEATWVLETWGEEFIEEGIPGEAFADGCAVSFQRFAVGVVEAALVDTDGEVVAALENAVVVDLVAPGPQELGRHTVPAGLYDTVRAALGEAGELGGSVSVAGTLRCVGEEVAFDWLFSTAAAGLCEPSNLSLQDGGEGRTQLTIHGDHLFYDSLDDPDSVLRGLPLVQADADGDGVLARAELEAVAVAPLGYDVGGFAEVRELWAYLEAQVGSLLHIDGEGHCAPLGDVG